MSESVRKSIKQIALEEPKGVHVKCFIIYLLLLSIISYGGIYFIDDNNLIVLFSFIISMPIYLNFIKICLDSSRDKLIGVRDLFKIKKYSFKFILFYGLIILLVYLLNMVISLIPFGFIISSVIFLYIFPILIISPFVFLDNPKISFLEFMSNSFRIVNKKMILFYGLLFSFIFWYALGLVSLGLLYVWLIPYIFISMAYLYLYLKEEKTFKKEKILSDSIIIILFILFIVFLNILSFKLYPDNFNTFKGSINLINK